MSTEGQPQTFSPEIPSQENAGGFDLTQFDEQLPNMTEQATVLRNYENEAHQNTEALREEASRIWKQITRTLRPILRIAKLENCSWSDINFPGFSVNLRDGRLIVDIYQSYQDNTFLRENAFWLMNPDQIDILFNSMFPRCISDIFSKIEERTENAVRTKEQARQLSETLQTQYLPFYSDKDRKNPNFPLMQKAAYVIGSANSLPYSPQRQELLERARGLWQAIKTHPSIRKARHEDQNNAKAETRICNLHLILDEVAGEISAVKEVRKSRTITG